MNKEKLIHIAQQFYNTKTYDHAIRVANYAAESIFVLDDIQKEYVWCLGLAHDLLEDTFCSIGDLTTLGLLSEDIISLTINKNETYEDYLIRLKQGSKRAYVVKLADMKDHLMLKETLTDKLKEKYLNGLAILL